jgi:hypothetical protein
MSGRRRLSPPTTRPNFLGRSPLPGQLKGRDCSQNLPGPRTPREEQTLAVEERRFYPAHLFDVMVNRRLQRNEAARVHAQGPARLQLALVQGTAGMQKSRECSAGILVFECNYGRAPAAGEFITECEISNARRPAQMGVHRFAQRAGALAVHDPHPPDTALPALGKIIIEQPGDFTGAERM